MNLLRCLVPALLILSQTLAAHSQNEFRIKRFAGAPTAAQHPQVLHFWAKQGEYLGESYPKAVVAGNPLETQVNVKSRWPDGSIRDALIAFVLPGPVPQTDTTIEFTTQETCNCENPVSKQELLGPEWDFDARQTVSPYRPGCEGCEPQTASARDILERWDETPSTAGSMYWMTGPIVTEVVLAEHLSKQSDLGYAAAPPVRVRASGENCTETAPTANTTKFCVTDARNIAPGQFVSIMGQFRAETVRVCAVDAGTNSFQVGSASCPNVDGRGFGGAVTANPWSGYGGLPALTGRYRQPEKGEDRPLRPWFTVQFWHGVKAYKVNFHIGNFDSTKLQLQHVGYEARVGWQQPRVVYRYSVPGSLLTPDHLMFRPRTQFGLARADGLADQCTPEFWSGGFDRACISIRYPFEYWGSEVRIIPNYSSDFPIRAADVDLRVRTYNTSTFLNPTAQKLGAERRAPLGNGSMVMAMAATGGRDELGLWPTWCLDALHGYDWRALNLCELNAIRHHGAFPFFLLEGDTDRQAIFNGQDTQTAGRPVTLRSRPSLAQLVPWVGPTAIRPLSPDPEPGFTRGVTFDFQVDDAHMFDPYTLPYILTGDYALLHRAWMMGTYQSATGSTAPGLRVAGTDNRMSIGRFSQVRSTGRLLWSLAHAEAISPDGFAEKQWLRDTIHEWLAGESGLFDVKDTPYYTDRNTETGVPGVTRYQVWEWARNSASRYLWGSGAFAQSGVPHSMGYTALDFFNDPPVDIGQIDASVVHRATSPWMDNFTTIAFGRLAQLGWSEAVPLLRYKAQHCANTSTQAAPIGVICGSYRVALSLRTPIRIDTATNTIEHPGHNLVDGDIVEFTAGLTGIPGVLPPPLVRDRITSFDSVYFVASEVNPNRYKLKDRFGQPVVLNATGSGTIFAVTRVKTAEEQVGAYVKAWRETSMANWSAAGLGTSSDAYNNGYGAFQLAVVALACEFAVPRGCEAYQNIRTIYNRMARTAPGRQLAWDWVPNVPSPPAVAPE